MATSVFLGRDVQSGTAIRLWPPGQRTRKHVTDRMAANLVSLSSYYSPLEDDEASRLARQVEELAFNEGQLEADSTIDGSSAVRMYAKYASRVVMEVLKTGKLPIARTPTPSESSEEVLVKDVEVDRSSVTSYCLDISGGQRDVLDRAKAEELFKPLEQTENRLIKMKLSNWSFKKEAAEVAARFIGAVAEEITDADLSDIIAGQDEDEALEVLRILSKALEKSKLHSLDLSNNALGEKGVRAFGCLLSSQTHLRKLFFSNNGITEDAAFAIAQLLPSAKELNTLHFHNNKTGDDGVKNLCGLLKESAATLENLTFSTSRICCEGAVTLTEALNIGSNLVKLDVRDNMFGPRGGRALADTVARHQKLEELYLSDLGLEDEGAIAILKALENEGVAPMLRVLDMGNNEMTWRCGVHVARGVKKKRNMKKLCLGENELKNKGVLEMFKVLKEKDVIPKIEEMELNLNEISSEGMIGIANGIARKMCMKRVDVDSNHISCNALRIAKAALDGDGCVGSFVLVEFEDNDERSEEDEDDEDDEGEGES